MATRTIEIYNATKRLLDLIIKYARNVDATGLLNNIFLERTEADDPIFMQNQAAMEQIKDLGPIGDFQYVAEWIRSNYSEDEWRSVASDKTISELEDWLNSAPASDHPTGTQQEEWLRGSVLSGSTSSNVTAAGLGNKILGSSGFHPDDRLIPDPTTQPGEEDMPGPDVERGPAVPQPDIREGASTPGFMDDPATLVGTPKTIPPGDGEKDGDDEDDEPYDLGALQDLIGGLDFFEGDDWLIQPEDIPEGFPPINEPWNVVNYLSYFKVDPNRALEFMRKTPGFATYTSWDADWSVMTPEEQDREIENTLHNVWIQAQAFGLDVPEDHPVLREIAIKIRRHGWTAEDGRIAQMFYDHKEFVMDQAVGKHQTAVDDVMDQARTHMISLTPDQRNLYAKRINLGLETIDGLETKFRKMAYEQYPHLQKLMDDGNNLGDYVGPYQAEAEALLERPVDMYGRDRNMFNEMFFFII